MAKKPAKRKAPQARQHSLFVSIVSFFQKTLFLLLLSFWKGLILILPSREAWNRLGHSPHFKKGLFISVCLLCSIGLMAFMRSELSQKPDYFIDLKKIQFQSGSITWAEGKYAKRIEAEILDDLKTRVSKFGTQSVFNDEYLEAIAQTLEESGWVQQTEKIERVFPGEKTGSQLLISLSIRKPILYTLYNNTIYFIDRDGFVLPHTLILKKTSQDSLEDGRIVNEEFLNVLNQSMRRVDGVQAPGPRPQTFWKNEQIIAALSVEKSLQQHRKETKEIPVQAYDVSGISVSKNRKGRVQYHPGKGGLRLYTSLSATPIIWGKAPVHAHSIEATATEKIKRFKAILKLDASLSNQSSYYLNREPLK